MKSFFLPNADNPAIQWLGFILFLVLVCVCIGGFVVWLKTTKSKPKRKHKHRHHRPTNPTLAETGGLPPKRAPDQLPPGP